MPHADVTDRLQQLLEELEQGWLERRDDCLVDRLAAEYPELAEELYVFFADLIQAELALDTPRPELAALDTAIRERLAAEAPRRAAAGSASMPTTTPPPTAPTPEPATGAVPDVRRRTAAPRAASTGGAPPGTIPFGKLLKDQTGRSQTEIATALELTPDFLIQVSDHADLLSDRVRDELVARASRAFHLDSDRHIRALRASLQEATAGLPKAASRARPYPPERLTFGVVVERSSLSDEQKQFWLSLQ